MVWRAADTRLANRPVALKFLREDLLDNPAAVARFDTEADALAAVHHPNIVGVLDRGAWTGSRYLVTEFVEGRSLAAWLDLHRTRRQLADLATVRAVFDQIGAGIGAAHVVRVPGPIVHRDVKPANILVRRLPSGELLVKLLDFGLAQLGGRSGTNSGALLGTPVYMAPEQAMGNVAAVGPGTDVFALGVVLIEMFTLAAQPDPRTPWWGASLQQGVGTDALRALRADVPVGVWEVVSAALHARPEERFGSACAFRTALATAWREAEAGSPAASDVWPYADALSGLESEASPASSPPATVPGGPASPPLPAGPATALMEPARTVAMDLVETPAPTSVPSGHALPRRAAESRSGLLLAGGAALAMFGAAVGTLLHRTTHEESIDPPPVTVLTTSGPAPGAVSCRVQTSSAFHLRPSEGLGSVGPEYPAGTALDVLAPGALWRRGNRIHRVRVVTDGALGYAFLSTDELSACPEYAATRTTAPVPSWSAREERAVSVGGLTETWRLAWQSQPTVECRDYPTTCPCANLTVAERGVLDLVRLRGGVEVERFALTPFAGFGLGSPFGESFLLRRWVVPEGFQGESVDDAMLARLPTADVMNLADYDRDGRATEFVLQVGTGSCGHAAAILVGVSPTLTTLHAFGTEDHPDRPLVLREPADWETLRSRTVVESALDECGDHGSEQADIVRVVAQDGAPHASRTRYACTPDFRRAGMISFEAL